MVAEPLTQGVAIGFLGGGVAAARNSWAAEPSEIAIYGREDGYPPFLLVLQYASGRVIKVGEFDSFEKAYEDANGGEFDPPEESAGGRR